jgi:UDP-N-acetylmuramoyl-L-alanyl-D-glutamate--2,6-diaminopimelate ligase
VTVATARIVAALEREGLLVERKGELPEAVQGLTDDSREVVAGGLFAAIRGSTRDGHDFLPDAARRGAAVAIVEQDVRTTIPSLRTTDARRAASIAAAAYYGEPGSKLSIYAVTGTNGKTTTVGILRHLLDSPKSRAASIGTLGVLFGSEGAPILGGAGLTTPGAIELQRVLRELVDAGVRSVAMEVSSHSLDQRRIEGIRFDAAIFTNLTRDHLDYHGSMEAYRETKLRLVGYLADGGVAVVNQDDPNWTSLRAARHKVTFGIHATTASVRATDIAFSPRGSDWTLSTRADNRQARVHLPLIGSFNVANALGAAAAAWARNWRIEEIAERLGTLPQVPGRLELLHEHPTVLRDYAHTPDALERALDAVRPFTTGRLIVVFGCGGDRDRGKRPEMGRIAEERADHVIITSDNPRTEDPERILDDIAAGMRRTDYERIEERRTAIARALEIADPAGDVVLLAGKGHETYQIRGTTQLRFDEREIVGELLGEAV